MHRPADGAVLSERAQVLELLDEFQAAERVGAEALGRWAVVCRDPRLRGGLKVIGTRDRGHAALAEARLRALGGEPRAVVSSGLATFCAVMADPQVSDRVKLAMLLARLPAQVEELVVDFANRIEADAETRALLETIGQDERASLRWLRWVGEALGSENPWE